MLSIEMYAGKRAAGMSAAAIDLGSWRRNLRIVKHKKMCTLRQLCLCTELRNMDICALCNEYECSECPIKKVEKKRCRHRNSTYSYIKKAKTHEDLVARIEDLIILLEACSRREQRE